MLIFIGLVLGFAAIWACLGVLESGGFLRKKIKASKPKLSNPAQAIMKAYNGLPESSQRLDDLEEKLIALDAELGIQAVNRHYGQQRLNYDTYTYEWELDWNGCSGKHDKQPCKFFVYREVASQIFHLQQSVAKQNEVLQLENINNLDFNSVVERIRQEKEIVDEVTSDLKKGLY